MATKKSDDAVKKKNVSPKSKKLSPKEKAKKKRRKIILFILEIFVLLIMVVVLYSVLKVEKAGKVDIPEEMIVINDGIKEKEQTTMKGYRNIALFGVDSTSGELKKRTRSDTIMIASINQDTGDCKLVSVFRDSYLNLGNDTYNKCNAAYAKGGPEQAINMLNMNLDLNITDFVTVGFGGMTDTIDALGGVMIDVTQEEISHLNNYQICIAEDLKRSYTPVSQPGYQLLDGLQATAYCRIRYTAGDDFKRTERQRNVLMAMADKAKTSSPTTLVQAATAIFDSQQIYTSLDLTEIVGLLKDVGKYSIVANDGFPQADLRTTGNIGSAGSSVVPKDLEQNVAWLHGFLFGAKDYQPSADVKKYSQAIKSETDKYLK